MATQLRNAESTRSINTSTTAGEEEEEKLEEEEEVEEEEEEEEKLEEEVKEMAKKLKEYRSTLPNQLKSSLSSLLDSQRPPLSLSSDVSQPGPSSRSQPQGSASCSENSNKELAASNGDRTSDDIRLLNDKISSNIAAMPKVLKRMNECISRIDRLVSADETIHPVFKKKKS